MMAPLNFSAPPKPKIGFSIDSIVGQKSSGEDSRSALKSPPARRCSSSPASRVSPAPSTVQPPVSSVSPAAGPPSPLSHHHPDAMQLAALQQHFNLQRAALRGAASLDPMHPALMMRSHLPGLPMLPSMHLHGPLSAAHRPQGFPPPPPPPVSMAQHLPPAFMHPQLMSLPPQTEYPLLPWLHSRHGRIFPAARFPGPDFPAFLLQPFRKPKRIRTAFSPSQLLKLEHAFEKNHYVVGQERKQLAQTLNLSETQVKVWFQNRRTKHKRVQDDDPPKDGVDKTLLNVSGDQLLSYEESDEEEAVDMEGGEV